MILFRHRCNPTERADTQTGHLLIAVGHGEPECSCVQEFTRVLAVLTQIILFFFRYMKDNIGVITVNVLRQSASYWEM